MTSTTPPPEPGSSGGEPAQQPPNQWPTTPPPQPEAFPPPPPPPTQLYGAGSWTGAGAQMGPDQEQLLRAFVGSNSDYYLRKWQQMGPYPRASWNWAAFFLSGWWLVYRKMWGLGIGILLAMFLLNLVGQFVGGDAMTLALSAASVLGILGLAVTVGLMGNGWYRKHVERNVQQIAATVADPNARYALLAQSGGTSIGASVGFAAGWIILFMLVTAGMLWGSGAFDRRVAPMGGTGDPANNSNISSSNTDYAALNTSLIGTWASPARGCATPELQFSSGMSATIYGPGGETVVGYWAVIGNSLVINDAQGRERLRAPITQTGPSSISLQLPNGTTSQLIRC